MTNKLLLDKSTLSDPNALANCKVGDTKQLTVTCKVTRDEGNIFEADVTDIEYGDGTDDGAEETTEAPPAPSKPTKKAAAPTDNSVSY